MAIAHASGSFSVIAVLVTLREVPMSIIHQFATCSQPDINRTIQPSRCLRSPCGVHAAQGMSSATCRGSTHPPVTRSWTWRAVGQAVAKYGSWSLASVLVKHLSGAWTGQTRLKVVSTPIKVITFGRVTQDGQRLLSDLVTNGVLKQARRQGISARPLRVAVEGAPVDSQADAFVLAWTSCEGGALGWTVPMTPPPE